MNPTTPPTTLILAGPTGVGKTRLAIALAERHGLEIISADSMQVYRGMEIGTAQPDAEERARANFHLCGIIDPSEPFNVQRFLELSSAAHAEIESRGARPIYAGGTGLYLRALRWGIFEDPTSDPSVRAALDKELEAEGPAALHARLAAVDPEAARKIPAADGVRIVRALEVLQVSGLPIAELQKQWETPTARFAHTLVILNVARETVRKGIAKRADAMLAGGWIEEVEALLARGVAPTQHCFKALGYREIVDYLNGSLTREEMREQIVNHTSQFARRQMTWLQRETPAVWIEHIPAQEERTLKQLEEFMVNHRAKP